MIIREYTMGDLKQMIMIWNEIVDENNMVLGLYSKS